jgi:hypothetical protein
VRLTGSTAFRNWDPNLEKQLYKNASKLRGSVSLTGPSTFRNWYPNLVKQLYKIANI